MWSTSIPRNSNQATEKHSPMIHLQLLLKCIPLKIKVNIGRVRVVCCLLYFVTFLRGGGGRNVPCRPSLLLIGRPLGCAMFSLLGFKRILFRTILRAILLSVPIRIRPWTRSMLSALQRMGGQNHVVAGSEAIFIPCLATICLRTPQNMIDSSSPYLALRKDVLKSSSEGEFLAKVGEDRGKLGM